MTENPITKFSMVSIHDEKEWILSYVERMRSIGLDSPKIHEIAKKVWQASVLIKEAESTFSEGEERKDYVDWFQRNHRIGL